MAQDPFGSRWWYKSVVFSSYARWAGSEKTRLYVQMPLEKEKGKGKGKKREGGPTGYL
jgi:hypothetical protein